MKKLKKQSKQYKCSVCRKVGHTKKGCSKKVKEQKKKITGLPKSVMVRVRPDVISSAHVVDLKKDREKSIWDDVKAYQPESYQKEERKIVDFAEMIRNYNLNNNEQRILPRRELKMRSSKNRNISKILAKYYQNIIEKFNITFSDSRYQIANLPAGRLGSKINKKRNLKSSSRPEFGTKAIFNHKINYRRLAFASMVLCILMSLPFPAIGYYNKVKNTSASVVESSTNAFLSLQSSTVAVMHANIDQAQFDINSALVSFGEAENLLEKDYRILQYVAGLLPIIGTEVKSRQHLLMAGHSLALGNTYLVKGIKEITGSQDLPLTDKISILANHWRSAIPQYEEALENLSSVDNKVVPVEYQQSFSDFKLLFSAFVSDMRNLADLSDTLKTVFGNDQLKRYLIVFQNNNELRPTGGFAGSFAVLDVQKGKILNLDIPGGGSYDLKGQLKTQIKPPLPLQLVNKRWEFQDANWFPDFSASAQKMSWFYEQSRGATVDGVIAINASVLEKLLSVLGPIESDELGSNLTADNAIAKLQYQIEENYYHEKPVGLVAGKETNKPKEILSSVASTLLDRLPNLSAVEAIGLLTTLHQSLLEKDIQVYFTDNFTQKQVSSYGWTGSVSSVVGSDYLLVVNSNIQGEKSDAKIKQTIEHQAVVEDDGSVVDTVVITRTHTGVPGELFYGANNVDYLRLYVPAGAELLEAGGFVYPPEEAFRVPEDWYLEDEDLLNQEKNSTIDSKTGTHISNEFGKTVFGNWSMTEPGGTSKIYFIYRLPFKVINSVTVSNVANEELSSLHIASVEKYLDWNKWKELVIGKEKILSSYSLLAQKQSGITSVFSTRIIYPDNWSPLWKENNDLELAKNGVELITELTTDKVIGIVMERK